MAAETRWEGHRRRGTDLPFVDEAGDAKATRAEAVVADMLDCEWVDDAGGADSGWDMVFRGWQVDVKRIPPGKNLLLVKTWKPIVDIYVAVLDGKPVGWEWGIVMERQWVVDFGYTHGPNNDPDESYFKPYWNLMPIPLLLGLLDKVA